MPIELSGMDEMLARLQKANNDVGAIRKKAILAGAKVIQDEIIARAPEDTGNLKRNIAVSEIQIDSDGAEYVDVGPTKGKAFYAKFLEFSTTKMKARPFVEPAFIAKRKEALAAMGEVVKEAVNNV
jgi:HK97 gp10 family phage protein